MRWCLLIFPWIVSCLRPLCGTPFRLPRPLSLMFPYSRRMMRVLRMPLQSVVSDRNGLGILILLQPAVLMGFTNEANIVLEAVWPNFVSQCCADRVSLTVTKHLDFCPRTIRPMWLQGLYLHILFLVSKCWMLPRHIYPMGNLGPKEMRMLEGGVILDALL